MIIHSYSIVASYKRNLNTIPWLNATIQLRLSLGILVKYGVYSSELLQCTEYCNFLASEKTIDTGKWLPYLCGIELIFGRSCGNGFTLVNCAPFRIYSVGYKIDFRCRITLVLFALNSYSHSWVY